MVDVPIQPFDNPKTSQDGGRHFHRRGSSQEKDVCESNLCLAFGRTGACDGSLFASFERDIKYPPVSLAFAGRTLFGGIFNSVPLIPSEVFKRNSLVLPYETQIRGNNKLLLYFRSTAPDEKSESKLQSPALVTFPRNREKNKCFPELDSMLQDGSSVRLLLFLSKDWEVLYGGELETAIGVEKGKEVEELARKYMVPKKLLEGLDKDSVLHVYKPLKVANSSPFYILVGELESVSKSDTISFYAAKQEKLIRAVKGCAEEFDKVIRSAVGHLEKLTGHPCPHRKINVVVVPDAKVDAKADEKRPRFEANSKISSVENNLMISYSALCRTAPEEFVGEVVELLAKYWIEDDSEFLRFVLTYLVLSEADYIKTKYSKAVLNFWSKALNQLYGKCKRIHGRNASMLKVLQIMHFCGREIFIKAVGDFMDELSKPHARYDFRGFNQHLVARMPETDQRNLSIYDRTAVRSLAHSIEAGPDGKITKFAVEPFKTLDSNCSRAMRKRMLRFRDPEEEKLKRKVQVAFFYASGAPPQIFEATISNSGKTELPEFSGKPVPEAVFVNYGGWLQLRVKLDEKSYGFLKKELEKMPPGVERLTIEASVKDWEKELAANAERKKKAARRARRRAAKSAKAPKKDAKPEKSQ